MMVRLLRFAAWCGVAIAAFVLAGIVHMYAPCFTGGPGTCVSGLLLLAGGVVVLAVGGSGALVLVLTRRRPRRAGGKNAPIDA